MNKDGKPTPIDTLFNSTGQVKFRVKKSPFFYRPAYQYTHAEVGKIETEDLDKDPELR